MEEWAIVRMQRKKNLRCVGMDKKPSELTIKIRDVAELLTGSAFYLTGIFMFLHILFHEKEYVVWHMPLMLACLSAGIYFQFNSTIKRTVEMAVRKVEEAQMCESDTLFNDINADLKQELTDLVMSQKKDEAIKRYREETGRGLKKAKAVIEYLADTAEG